MTQELKINMELSLFAKKRNYFRLKMYRYWKNDTPE
jgi:hypothetical protein